MSTTLILDSTFLVDFEREQRRKVHAGAVGFLKAHADRSLAITFTIAGELAAGESLGSDRDAWVRFLSPFHLLGYTGEVAWQFGLAYRAMNKRGVMIGANDLWIAATALAHDLPVVTRNSDEFARVPGLRVFKY